MKAYQWGQESKVRNSKGEVVKDAERLNNIAFRMQRLNIIEDHENKTSKVRQGFVLPAVATFNPFDQISGTN